MARVAFDGEIQDPYNLRCAPQVLGACLDLIKRAETFVAYKHRIERGLEIVQKKDITSPLTNLSHEEQKDLNLALQYNMRLMIALLQ